MAVYVDNMRAAFRRMKMCHMVADTTAELLEMVDKIGVDRKWIQSVGTVEEHFDIALTKRAMAVRRGAVEIDRHGLVDVIQKKRAIRKVAVMMDKQDEQLPAVGGRRLPCTLNELERRAKRFLFVEQEKHNPDTALVAVLCDTVRLCREYADMNGVTQREVFAAGIHASEMGIDYENGETDGGAFDAWIERKQS